MIHAPTVLIETFPGGNYKPFRHAQLSVYNRGIKVATLELPVATSPVAELEGESATETYRALLNEFLKLESLPQTRLTGSASGPVTVPYSDRNRREAYLKLMLPPRTDKENYKQYLYEFIALLQTAVISPHGIRAASACHEAVE